MVRVQTQDFDLGLEISQLRAEQSDIGAVATFLGTVRDINHDASISGMELEPYPGMPERELEALEAQARARWPLNGVTIIHRVGILQPCEQIVMVAVASRHRHAAFEACEYIMDYLKTRAPFWKKEATPEGAHWVDARESDFDAAARWGEV
ncbi:MAG: molybdopterin synthase catalytic subunit MoaE [Halothiobacillaceae bacterium]|nr:molybdopterin synthase catalytic subunit MoaE [Halothiobacillaceae bacterium]